MNIPAIISTSIVVVIFLLFGTGSFAGMKAGHNICQAEQTSLMEVSLIAYSLKIKHGDDARQVFVKRAIQCFPDLLNEASS